MIKGLSHLAFQFFTLFSIVTIVFFLFSNSFPDPSSTLIGQNTDKKTQQAIIEELGLDKPLRLQYIDYLIDLSPISFQKEIPKKAYVVRNFGHKSLLLKYPNLRRSFQSREWVIDLLWDGFKNTGILALSAILLASTLGIFFGVLSGLYPHFAFSKVVVVLSMLGISAPSFFVAIIFSWLFGYVLEEHTHLSMVGSLYETNLSGEKILQIKNLLLPTLVLGIRPLSIITQLMRNSIIDEKDQQYVVFARSKGLSQKYIIKKHLLPNAINPVLTSISGWFASLLAGAFFVEYVFNWRGLGLITIDALEKSDLPVLMGSILLTATVFIFINAFLQVIYRKIDPRIAQ